MDLLFFSGGLAVGVAACYGLLRAVHSSLLRRQASLLQETEREIERMRREGEIRIKDEEIRSREKVAEQAERKRQEWLEQERSLSRKEASFDRKFEMIELKERHLEKQEQKIRERGEDLEGLIEERQTQIEEGKSELLRVAEMTRVEAREAALRHFEEEMEEEAAAQIQKAQERLEEDLEMRAQKTLAHAIQRMATSHSSESATSTVPLPNDDMKGRIIGREGRNIRSIEKTTGVDVIIDDTPGVVVISCFDNVRREIARRSLERLVEDGRIHPARIEEIVKETQKEVEDDIRKTARKVLHELDVPRVDARIQNCVGRLKYRSSYGQNQLEHAVEVSYLAGAIAGEMGLDPKLAKRCGLLHDIGKALDHEQEGGHPAIGAELARKCREAPEVVNSIAAHHGDVPFTSVYSVIAQVADAISAARPGARRDTMEQYIQRLEKLEEIATSFPGIEAAFAIQAGREIRVVVDSAVVDDGTALLRAREIARKIESELVYPGEVKVTIIRETRVTEYAR
ncbi:MAG: ribonuclease Y [Planctomycetota bacterium]